MAGTFCTKTSTPEYLLPFLKHTQLFLSCPLTWQADLPLVLPPPSLPASNIFADWPSGARSWPWKGMQNVDAYFGGSELHAMGHLIYIARALEATAPAAGSTFGPTAAAAAVNVTNALKQLLLKRLQLPCTFAVPGGGANPGSLCYDNLFKLVTTARAQSVSALPAAVVMQHDVVSVLMACAWFLLLFVSMRLLQLAGGSINQQCTQSCNSQPQTAPPSCLCCVAVTFITCFFFCFCCAGHLWRQCRVFQPHWHRPPLPLRVRCLHFPTLSYAQFSIFALSHAWMTWNYNWGTLVPSHTACFARRLLSGDGSRASMPGSKANMQGASLRLPLCLLLPC